MHDWCFFSLFCGQINLFLFRFFFKHKFSFVELSSKQDSQLSHQVASFIFTKRKKKKTFWRVLTPANWESCRESIFPYVDFTIGQTQIFICVKSGKLLDFLSPFLSSAVSWAQMVLLSLLICSLARSLSLFTFCAFSCFCALSYILISSSPHLHDHRMLLGQPIMLCIMSKRKTGKKNFLGIPNECCFRDDACCAESVPNRTLKVPSTNLQSKTKAECLVALCHPQLGVNIQKCKK